MPLSEHQKYCNRMYYELNKEKINEYNNKYYKKKKQELESLKHNQELKNEIIELTEQIKNLINIFKVKNI